MRTLAVPVVGQHLSEVNVIVRPDGIEVSLFFRIHIQAHILGLRNDTVGITIVAVAITVFDIAIVQIDTIDTR